MEANGQTGNTATGPAENAVAAPLLTISGLAAGYGKRHVIADIDMTVDAGQVVGVLGHNGAGKTTLLKAIFRMLPLTSGTVELDGVDLARATSVQTVASGMSFTPAETPIFRDLTVWQNLELGAYHVRDRSQVATRIDEVTAIFPILGERKDQIAGRFSGGQQRQLSLGIALMAQPRLMLLDEPSLGISPAVVVETFATIRRLALERGMSVLIVEQNIKALTAIADQVHVLRHGALVQSESGAQARARTEWWDLF